MMTTGAGCLFATISLLRLYDLETLVKVLFMGLETHVELDIIEAHHKSITCRCHAMVRDDIELIGSIPWVVERQAREEGGMPFFGSPLVPLVPDVIYF